MPDSPSLQASAGSPRLRLKICGLRDPGQAGAIAAMGVDAIGVVAVERSPRFLPLEQRPEVFAAVRASGRTCLGVLVVADPEDADLPALAATHGHQVVQLHGGESMERCAQLRRVLGPDVKLWKALRIRSKEDVCRCEAYMGVVDGLLLDAWMPGQLGGTGRSIPSSWLEKFAMPLPWWLAGGISPETLEDLVTTVHPHGVDASSGVEVSPGWKDLERVRLLLERVKNLGPSLCGPRS